MLRFINPPVHRLLGSALLFAALLSGCGQDVPGSNNTVGEVLGTQTTSGNLINPAGATPVAFDSDGLVTLVGTIDSATDVDAYDLGAVSPGDRFSVSATQSASLDAAIALFDDDSNLTMLNDDSFLFQSPTAPLLAFTVRSASAHLYLVVVASPKSSSSGDYTVNVARTAEAVPAAEAVVVVLDWNGASGVSVGGGFPANVPAFAGSFIDPSYSNDTQAIIDATVAFIREDFADLNVSIFLDGDPAIPAGARSTIYFGTFSTALLGLADSVDYYNGNPDQEAIIFTDAFALFMPLGPSVTEMAQTIANVASHEIGHLLGLNHTQDPRSVMDITASAFELMQNESFRRAPMNLSVFATGFQNAVSLLLAAVGGTADPDATRPAYDMAQVLKDPAQAARAIDGSIVFRKDIFCAHQCSLASK